MRQHRSAPKGWLALFPFSMSKLEQGTMIRYIGKHHLMIFSDTTTLLAALETKRKRKLRAEQRVLGLLLGTCKKKKKIANR